MKKQCYPFKLFRLPYDFGALEPYIDAKTMELHHDRHLRTYTDNLNAALKPYKELHNWSLERLLGNLHLLPVKLRTPVRNNAGGVFNHIYYFSSMRPVAEMEEFPPVAGGKLGEMIECCFGSWERFKSKFSECAAEVFGSGYLWLVADRRGNLKLTVTANQDTPITKGLFPIMCIDVWEHAYYLKHYNDRKGYIADWFNVINTDFAETNYEYRIKHLR